MSNYSCNKSEDLTNSLSAEESSNLLSFEEYMEIYSRKSIEGSLLIEAHNQMATSSLNHAHITEKHSLEGKNSRINIMSKGKSILSEKSNIQEIPKSEILNMFGSEIQYSLGGLESRSSQSLSIPSLIQIDMNSGTVGPGSVISWNVDPSNDHGVLLYATFTPSSQIDLFLAEQNLQSITRGIVLPDELGSYTITSEDLEIFPDNSIINVTVARGNTTTATDKSPTVTGVSKSTASVQIDY
ncbi:MAG: hypothetical protein AAGC64_00855 [Bacteroidota bacterium]